MDRNHAKFDSSGVRSVRCIRRWIHDPSQRPNRPVEGAYKAKTRRFLFTTSAIRAEITAKSDVRVKLSGLAGESWAELFTGIDDPFTKQKIQEEKQNLNNTLQDYSNRQMTEELVPLFRKMLGYFSKHMWLAEQSTLLHYPTLVEFVEIWNRFLEKSIPAEVLRKVNHAEKALHPLYDDLQKQFHRLTAELKN